MTKVSLDACIIIDILANNPGDSRTPDEWHGIHEIVADLDAQRISLVLPSIIFAELLPSHNPSGLSTFEQVTQRSNVEVVDITVGIAKLAARLKDRSMAISKKIKTLDSIFLATAELVGANTLYSTDKRLLEVGPLLDLKTKLCRPGTQRISLFPSSPKAPFS